MRLIAPLLCLLAPAIALGQEDKIQLRDDPDRALVMGNCVLCHSLDYIPMNSPFLDRKGWETEVSKMINVMGAPIDKPSAPKIVNYLVKYYGKK